MLKHCDMLNRTSDVTNDQIVRKSERKHCRIISAETAQVSFAPSFEVGHHATQSVRWYTNGILLTRIDPTRCARRWRGLRSVVPTLTPSSTWVPPTRPRGCNVWETLLFPTVVAFEAVAL